MEDELDGRIVELLVTNGRMSYTDIGKATFAQYCANCHGEAGKGDGIAGQNLPIRPQDLTEGRILNALPDHFLHSIIAHGGQSVGLSPLMPNFTPYLSDIQIGEGTVVEEMTSTIPGGTCLVRIKFQDGRERTFSNDLDSQSCCYYFGLRKYWAAEALLGTPTQVRRAPRRPRMALTSSGRGRGRSQT